MKVRVYTVQFHVDIHSGLSEKRFDVEIPFTMPLDFKPTEKQLKYLAKLILESQCIAGTEAEYSGASIKDYGIREVDTPVDCRPFANLFKATWILTGKDELLKPQKPVEGVDVIRALVEAAKMYADDRARIDLLAREVQKASNRYLSRTRAVYVRYYSPQVLAKLKRQIGLVRAILARTKDAKKRKRHTRLLEQLERKLAKKQERARVYLDILGELPKEESHARKRRMR